MTINNFISNYQGGARASRFRVQITWPAIVGTPAVRDEIVVQAAQHPASVLGVIQVPYKGRQIPIPGDRTFEEWTITVNNDANMAHREAFERWHNLMNGYESNVQGTESYRDLVSTIDVSQLGVDDDVVKTYKLYNAWPSNVSAIDLGYDQQDTIQTYTVSWSYSHFDPS